VTIAQRKEVTLCAYCTEEGQREVTWCDYCTEEGGDIVCILHKGR